MKKLLSVFLAVVLLLALCPSALAASKIVRTSQKLTVNGSPVSCDIYNIDGSNYFKLRDLAALMNGTRSQFAVGYDEKTRTVSVTLGEPYTEIGGELQIGEDKSKKAAPSKQTILINGTPCSDLSVYNIGGNNFFKLRDLGSAVGFAVDYDDATRTMIVESYKIPKKLTRVSWSDQYGNHGEELYTYDAKGNLVKMESSENGVLSYATTYTYDSQGRVTASASSDGKHSSSSVYASDGSCTQTSHDEDEYAVTDWKWTSNAKGITILDEYTSTYPDGRRNYGRSTYTADGKELTTVTRSYDESRLIDEYSTTWTYDSKGRMASCEEIYDENDGANTRTMTTYNAAGGVVSEDFHSVQPNGDYTDRKTVNEFNAAGKIARSVLTGKGLITGEDGEQYTYTDEETTTYTYDANGALTVTEERGDGWITKTVYTYDAKGLCVSEKTTDYYVYGDTVVEGSSVATTRSYDAAGNLLTMNYQTDYDFAYSVSYSYDSGNRMISEVYRSEDPGWSDNTEYTYAYDNYGNQIEQKCNSRIAYYNEETGGMVKTESTSVERTEVNARGIILHTVSKQVEDGYSACSEDSYTYDLDDNLVKHVDIDNDVTVTYIYEYGA